MFCESIIPLKMFNNRLWLIDMGNENATIEVYPHSEKTFLREKIIKPMLKSDGFIDKKYINKVQTSGGIMFVITRIDITKIDEQHECSRNT